MLNARVTKHLFALWLSRQTDCVHVCVHGGLCVWICSHPKECTGFVGLCVHTWTNCHVPLRGCLCKCVNVVVCLHCTSLELSCSFINTRVNQQLTAAVFGAERTWALIWSRLGRRARVCVCVCVRACTHTHACLCAQSLHFHQPTLALYPSSCSFTVSQSILNPWRIWTLWSCYSPPVRALWMSPIRLLAKR